MTNTFALTHPIPQMGSTPPVTTVTFRRPKLRDIREINRAAKADDEIGQMMAMIAGCTFLTPEQIDQIDAADMVGLSEACVPFFPTDPGSKTKT